MPFTVQKELPRAAVVLDKLPLAPEFKAQVAKDQAEIKAILSGEDDRKIMIIGPLVLGQKTPYSTLPNSLNQP